MRLLGDENFPKPIVEVFRADGCDVLWARSDCCGWTDTALLDFAESRARIMMTQDKDFWQIAVHDREGSRVEGCIGLSERDGHRATRVVSHRGSAVVGLVEGVGRS